MFKTKLALNVFKANAFFPAICLFMSVAFLCFGETPCATTPSKQDDEGSFVDIEVLPKEVRQTLEKIHVGMTQKEVEKVLRMDGGLLWLDAERYYVPDFVMKSKVVMIKIGFQAEGMPDAVYADERLRIEWVRGHDWTSNDHFGNAVVRRIGKPYLSGVAID